MGIFYVNYTVRSTDQAKTIKALAGRNAFVTVPSNGSLVVFDEESDSQTQDVIQELGKKLSESLCAPVLAVLNHDDDILRYSLFENGDCIDEYDSCPGYFDSESEPQNPSGGNAEVLCSVFGSQNVNDIKRILETSSFDDGYDFAIERHADFVNMLSLPKAALGYGHTYIAQGELPVGLSKCDISKA